MSAGSQQEETARGRATEVNLSCYTNMSKASLLSIITIFSNQKNCHDGKFSKVITHVTYTCVRTQRGPASSLGTVSHPGTPARDPGGYAAMLTFAAIN